MRAGVSRRWLIASCVASAFRDGVWSPEPMADRAAHDLGVDRESWLLVVAEAVCAEYPACPHDAPRALTARVADHIDAGRTSVPKEWQRPVQRSLVPIQMQGQTETRAVPQLNTTADLARYLNLDAAELDWYADVRSLERTVTSENLRHYNYSWRTKRRGGDRLLEAPKQHLKAMQRKILHDVLDSLPTHNAAHGFCQGRSIHSFAAPHAGRHVVIRIDLRHFFTSVRPGRVFGIFRSIGYSEDVAHLLTGCTTNLVPDMVLRARPDPEDRYRDVWLRAPHLPQGAPTSPALANAAARGLDRRLSALAETFDVQYTRYADDLAFSGGRALKRGVSRLVGLVDAIVQDEGFVVAADKTKVRTPDQRQVLTGLVVNSHVNVHRRDYDQLKAVLHDAVVNGAAAANRVNHPNFRAHLEGRIGFVQATNPQRAHKLWRTFDQIAWAD